MAESNSKKLLDILKDSNQTSSGSAVKKDSETVALGKIYNFLLKDKEDKKKRQVELDRIQKQSDIQQEFSTTVPSSTIPTASPTKEPTEKKSSPLGGLAILGIVAAGVGVYVFSDEIKEKIKEIQKYFEESTWMNEFKKLEDLFNFDDLLEKFGIEDIPESVEKGAGIADFDASDLNKLTQGGTSLLGEEEFKQIQSQHKELEGKSYTDVEANIAAQGFKAKDIQQQLGTTDLAQTFAAEKIGVESTKKLYQAPETATEIGRAHV